MEHVDRTASRVATSSFVGFAGGVAYATLRGYPVGPTSFRVGASFALVATSLFGTERIAYVAFKDYTQSERQLVLTSHAFSGVVGGGLNGYLYQKKPLRGMFYFVPFMLGVGFLELEFQRRKKLRQEALMAEQME